MNNHIDEKLNKRAVGLKALFGSQFINILLSLLRTFLFTIYLAPKDFGLLALSTTVTGFISLLKEFGYSVYIIQKQDIESAEIDVINTRVILLGFMAFILICLITIPIVRIYEQPELAWILPLIGVQFVLNSFTVVPYALLKKRLLFKKVAVVDVASGIVSITIGLITMIFIRNYWVLISSTLFYFLTQMILTKRIANFVHRFTDPFTKKYGKDSNFFGSRLTIFNIFTFVSVNIDKLIIAKLFGYTALGIYSKSYEFGVTNFDKLRQPIQQVYFSEIALESSNKDKIYSSFLQHLYLLFTILIVIIGPTLIIIDIVVPKIFGSKWAEISSLLPPFLIASFVWIAMSLLDQLLIIRARLNTYVILGSLKAIVGFASIIIASFWRIEAIAWSFLIYHIVIFVPFCNTIIKEIGFSKSEAWKNTFQLGLITISSCIVVTLPWFLNHFQSLSLLASFSTLAVCIFLLLFFVWPSLRGFKQYKTFISVFKLPKVAKVE